VFFGTWENGELVAVAGTHLAVPAEGVGAIGNVYTRRDRRGLGLAGALTSAVAGELLRMGVRTIGLNVTQRNAAAIRVYERLGFFRYCDFIEGPVAHAWHRPSACGSPALMKPA
jgi:predicted GNAT family acetyltransferase